MMRFHQGRNTRFDKHNENFTFVDSHTINLKGDIPSYQSVAYHHTSGKNYLEENVVELQIQEQEQIVEFDKEETIGQQKGNVNIDCGDTTSFADIDALIVDSDKVLFDCRCEMDDIGEDHIDHHCSDSNGKKLYDRVNQEQLLKEAYARIIGSRKKINNIESDQKAIEHNPELILITGPSGTGKTSLATSIRYSVEQDNGFFVYGKFERLRKQRLGLEQQEYCCFRSQPAYSAFISAISDYIQQILNKGDEEFTNTARRKILKMIGSEVHEITKAIPALQQFLNFETSDNSSDIVSATSCVTDSSRELDSSTCKMSSKDKADSSNDKFNKKNFHVIFRRLLRSICSPSCPLVMLLDDIQWADGNSLDLLKAIASPSIFGINQGLMIVGTCRGNEVSFHDELAVALRSIEDSGAILTEIKVENLSLPAVLQLVLDVQDKINSFKNKEEYYQLAKRVYHETDGNAFFVIQYLKSLDRDDNLLSIHDSMRNEKKDESGMLLTKASISSGQTSSYCSKGKNLINYIVFKMKSLPTIVQEVLKVASCLPGIEFREDILCFAANAFVATEDSSSQILSALEVATQKGIISFNKSSEKCNSFGRFSHDKFKEAAYYLICDTEKAKFHYSIARELRDKFINKGSIVEHSMLLTDLIGCGHSEIMDQKEKCSWAQICLRAAINSAQSSGTFGSAYEFVKLGLHLLKRHNWGDNYDLFCELYNTAAELAYCNGNHEEVDRLVQEIIKHAISFQDQIQGLTIRILSLGSRGDTEASMELNIDILKKLGEHFPRKKISKGTILADLLRTKMMLMRKSETDIFLLPYMSNPKALASMNLINLLYRSARIRNNTITPLVAFRLVRLTLRYGLSPMSSVGFTYFAIILVQLGMIEEGYRYGHLALHLLEKFPETSFTARAMGGFYGNVVVLKEPLRNLLNPLLRCHKIALRTGDVESGMVCGVWHAIVRVYIGDTLSMAVEHIDYYSNLCKDYAQAMPQKMIDPYADFCSKLMNINAASAVQISTDESSSVEENKATQGDTFFRFLRLHSKCLAAIYLNQFQYADFLCNQINKFDAGNVLLLVNMYHIFCVGIVAAIHGRDNRSKQSLARKMIRKLKKMAQYNPVNILSKTCLIEAELAVSAKKFDIALVHYDHAILHADREELVNEKALAYERAALMLHTSCYKAKKATEYFEKARGLYEIWGAKVKVNQLDYHRVVKIENLS